MKKRGKHVSAVSPAIGHIQMALASYLLGQGFDVEHAERGWELLKAEVEPAQNIQEFTMHLQQVADQLRKEVRGVTG